MHLGPPGQTEPPVDSYGTIVETSAACLGAVQVVYIRKGASSRWIALGRMCLACHAFWPAPAKREEEG